jgi:hypothetical protein
MIEVIDTETAKLLQIKIIEDATPANIGQIKPVIKKHAEENDDPRLMFIFSGLDEWGKVVKLWTNLNMQSDQVKDFSRIALVGRESWKGWLTNAIEQMVDTDLRFFGENDRDEARKWVEQ